MMTHTDVRESADKALLAVAVKPVGDTLPVEGSVKGEGGVLGVIENGANALITLRFRLKNVKFEAIEQAAKAGNVDLPAGSLILPASSEAREQIRQLGLQAVAMAAAPNVPKHLVDLPRVAMYSTWSNTQDVGWVRYAMDKFEVPFDLIYKERVKRGNLRASYDVIVIPSQGGRGGAKGLVFDIESRGKPFAYTKSSDFPTLGIYGESQDITGGMGLKGVEEFDKFVNDGGVLVTLGASSYFPAEFGLARNVDAQRPSAAFYAPGPIVQAEILKPNHPIFYGYTERTIPVRWAGGPLLRVSGSEARNSTLMRFPGGDASVMSGLMRSAGETRGRPAVVEVPVGGGHIVMFATNPAYRWQNLGEFGMLANTIMHFNDFPKQGSGPGADSSGGN